MSIQATLTFEQPIAQEDWDKFCQEHDIEPSPQTVGYDAYYHKEIEILRDDKRFAVNTVFVGYPNAYLLCTLVKHILQRWPDGTYQCDDTLMSLLPKVLESDANYLLDKNVDDAEPHNVRERALAFAKRITKDADQLGAQAKFVITMDIANQTEKLLREQDKLTRHAIASELIPACQPIQMFLTNDDALGGFLKVRDAERIAMNCQGGL